MMMMGLQIPTFLTMEALMIFTGFVASFYICFLLIPVIIRASEKFNLYDRMDGRKIHSGQVSRLGGLGIYAGFLTMSVLWFLAGDPKENSLLITAILIVLIVGLLDDIRELSPKYKFIGQLIASFLIAHAGIRLDSFYGVFGIGEFSVVLQYFITMVVITGIMNALNLMDGIDGLAAGISFIGFCSMGVLMILIDNPTFALMCFTLAGSLLAFLRYNFHPARIFMGDTGSLLLGFMLAVIGVKLISSRAIMPEVIYPAEMTIVVSGILMVPVYDTFRVMATRLLKGRSPFSPDMTHMHHLLIQTGYNHRLASIILYFASIAVIITSIFLTDYSPGFSILVMGLLVVLLTEIISIKRILAVLLNKRITMSRFANIESRNRIIINYITRQKSN